jgi:peptidoglycan/LPS O-acetylase OafA/YrhL
MGHLYLSTTPSYEALQRFLIARLARVLPLYLLMVTACFMASRIIGPDFVFYFTPIRTP